MSCACAAQAKAWCTTGRAKKIVVCLTLVSLTAEAVNFLSAYLADVHVLHHVYAIAFRVVVPAIVLVINVLVVREVRRRTSIDAANNLGLQHQLSTSSNSAVPTVMLITTSLVYVLLCGPSSVLYVVQQWAGKTPFRDEDILNQCRMIATVLSLLVFAYNFYVYLIMGKQFRLELNKLFCPSATSSAAASAVVFSRSGHSTVRRPDA